MQSDVNDEDSDRDSGDFIIKWGVHRDKPLAQCPKDWMKWASERDWVRRMYPDFVKSVKRYLRYLDHNPGACIIPFGKKHRGKRLEQCRDLKWLEWCCKQSWARRRYPLWLDSAMKWLVVRPRRKYGVKRDIGRLLTAKDDVLGGDEEEDEDWIPSEEEDEMSEHDDALDSDEYEADVGDMHDAEDLEDEEDSDLEDFIVPDDDGQTETGKTSETQSEIGVKDNESENEETAQEDENVDEVESSVEQDADDSHASTHPSVTLLSSDFSSSASAVSSISSDSNTDSADDEYRPRESSPLRTRSKAEAETHARKSKRKSKRTSRKVQKKAIVSCEDEEEAVPTAIATRSRKKKSERSLSASSSYNTGPRILSHSLSKRGDDKTTSSKYKSPSIVTPTSSLRYATRSSNRAPIVMEHGDSADGSEYTPSNRRAKGKHGAPRPLIYSSSSSSEQDNDGDALPSRIGSSSPKKPSCPRVQHLSDVAKGKGKELLRTPRSRHYASQSLRPRDQSFDDVEQPAPKSRRRNPGNSRATDRSSSLEIVVPSKRKLRSSATRPHKAMRSRVPHSEEDGEEDGMLARKRFVRRRVPSLQDSEVEEKTEPGPRTPRNRQFMSHVLIPPRQDMESKFAKEGSQDSRITRSRLSSAPSNGTSISLGSTSRRRPLISEVPEHDDQGKEEEGLNGPPSAKTHRFISKRKPASRRLILPSEPSEDDSPEEETVKAPKSSRALRARRRIIDTRDEEEPHTLRKRPRVDDDDDDWTPMTPASLPVRRRRVVASSVKE